ncbi:ATP-binding protein [Streptomyces sp. BR123]|uniref:ATP-binding protein n=1 Tax=Streptomyces sp. BR123 TaxID=2749828 RepID=UPI0015C4838F|nr:ATP-binding protein [Streptomyces sp. BR123]NXY95424.1 ATP-binding protein [Streptomyces sp. BR123]
MISHSRRHCTVELQALPSRIGQIRRIVSAQLRHWQLDPLIDRAALGVTELLSNVHRHAQPDKRCTVEIELRLGRLTVSVYDSDPRLPVRRTAFTAAPEAPDAPGAPVARQAARAPATPHLQAGPDGPDPLDLLDTLETGGRGLALVEAVSEAWGARPQEDSPGKVVWFSLRAAPAAPTRPRPVRSRSTPVREPAPTLSLAADAEPAPVGLSVAAATAIRPG